MHQLADILAQTNAASPLRDAVETSHRLSWQGSLTLTQAIVIGVVLLLLSGIALWGESRLTGRRSVLVFWPLRIAVLALVLWMLLEPTDTTVERRTEHKSLAVIADTSGSMEIVDAADGPADARWAAALQPAGDTAIALCDRLQLAAGETHARLQAAEEFMTLPRAGTRLRAELDSAQRACERTQKLLEQLEAASLPGNGATQVDALAEIVRDDVTPALQSLLADDGAESPQARAATLRALDAKAEQVVSQARRLVSMTVDAAATDVKLPDTGQTSAQRSRRDKVQGLLQAAESTWLGDAGKEARIQRWTFDADMRPVATEDWRQSQDVVPVAQIDEAAPPLTNLTVLLEQVGRSAAGDRLEAVVLFTDGRHNAPGARDPLEVAGSLGNLPVYVVPVGDDRLLRDVLVHHLEAPRAVSKEDKIRFEALVTAIDCEGERIKVELIAKDQFENEEVVDSHDFTPGDARIDEPVTFSAQRDTVGRYEFLVRARPVADEASPNNNQEGVSVDVVESEISVLLADEAPRWEFRYLSRLFERDEHIEYDQLLFQPAPAGTGRLADSLQLPSRLEEWSRYRIVILGDIAPAQLPRNSQESLRDFVTERGGTLILIAGTHAMPDAYAGQPLAELLPVKSDAPGSGGTYSVAVTAEGRLSPAIQVADDPAESERAWQEAFRFTPVPWLSEYRYPKPTAHTLLRAVDVRRPDDQRTPAAVLCWQTIGRGRVVYFSAPDSYRLRARHGDRYHHAFWGQLLRWSIAPDLSAGSKTVAVRTDKQRYDAREPVQVTIELRNKDGDPVAGAKVRAVVEQYGQMVAQIDLEGDARAPGQYVGRFEQLPDGSMTVRPVGDDVVQLLEGEGFTQPVTTPIVISRTLNAEMNDTRSNPALLARIAELTGGQVVPPTAVSEIPLLASLSPNVIETESHQPLWNNWWCLVAISGLLIGEWIARKRMSLL